MAKTSLPALNDVLFAQIEALTNSDLKGDELREEIERSKAVTGLSKQIVDSANAQLKAAEFMSEYYGQRVMPSTEVFALKEHEE